MAYDSDRRANVMFGGSLTYGTTLGATNDTWELSAVDVPLINEHPASQFRQAGDTATFGVQAIGPSPLAYQWYHNGTLLPGEHSDTITITNVSADDVGPYHVLVSNDCGTRSSRTAILTLDPRLQIFSSANTITLIWSPEPNLVLESADLVTGPWAAIPNAPNPFVVGAFESTRFFRLRPVE